ncbi:MAG: cyclic nucleotide-binding protein [Desulfuromonas sp.]|nr:MAG: cyclic nucleotide-binding protein [Desulfuromonas sp.]
MQPEKLRVVHLLASLSPELLAPLASRLQRRRYAAGARILTQGDLPHELCFLLRGKVRVELTDGEGERHCLADLSAGATFGERALLTGERRSADVIAIESVELALLDATALNGLLVEIPELALGLCRQLARQLGDWAQRHQRDERENREILAHLVGWQLLPEFTTFPGNSSWVRQLNAHLHCLGRSDEHVLILGERGVWKDLAARLIHYHTDDSRRPVLFLDAASPPPLLREERTSQSPGLLRELGQEAALFGYAPNSASYARGIRRGMLELAHGGELILRNVEQLALPVQRRLLAAINAGVFCRHGEEGERSLQVRIIATSSEVLTERVEQGSFDRELLVLLSQEKVELLPLRQRRKDIPVIARQLLPGINRKHHKEVRRFSQEALNRLVDHDWPLNGSELYQVLSRAVLVCRGDEVGAEEIFLPGQVLTEGRFNLFSLPLVERLTRLPRFPVRLRQLTVPALLLVTLVLLFGPTRDNPANLLVWSLWWPFLLATAALTARSWCSYCPLEALGERCASDEQGARLQPGWLKRYGEGISLLVVAAILPIEQGLGLFDNPRLTGFLLLGLIGATLLLDRLFGRRSWCRYLCPLGRVVGLVARLSPLEMRSNPNVCLNRCRIDDCIKEKACPMGLHPSGVNSSDHCILCLSCVRRCPHRSMHLDLRHVTHGVLGRPQQRLDDAFFAVVFCAVVLAVGLAPSLDGGIPLLGAHRWTLSTWLAAGTIFGGYLLAVVGLSGTLLSQRGREAFRYFGQAYLPLALTGLFSLYLRFLIERGGELLPLWAKLFYLDRVLPPEVLHLDMGTLRIFLPFLLLGGVFISWRLLERLQKRHALPSWATILHRLLLLLTSLVLLWGG